MYLVRSLRTFIGTNAERVAAGLAAFLAGDEFIETDTGLVYIHNGMAWLLNSSAGSPGGSDTQVQFNDDGVFGGASSLIYDKILGDFRILGDGNSHLFMLDYSTNSIGFGTNGAFGTIALFNPSGIVYNDDGQDVDFRVESNNYSNIFKVDAGLDAVQIGTAAAGTIADFRSTGIVFNEEGENRDFRIEGDTATNLLITDAGLDAFRVGTTTAGALLDVAPTGIIFNNAEADIDFRIAGNSLTNGVYWDAGNGRLGLGTNTPVAKFELVSGALSSSNYAPQIRVGVNAGEYQGFYSTTANVFGMIGGAELDGTNTIARHTSATLLTMAAIDGSIRFYTNAGLTAGNNFTPSERMRIYSNGGVVIGSPTGGNKGAGTLNATAVYDDNVLLTDYVFEPDYPLLTIDAMMAFYEINKHLPTIPGRKEWEKNGKFSLGKLANYLWETVEVQAIYISQLHKRLGKLEHGN